MKYLKLLGAAAALVFSLNASALVIDTNPGWDGSTNLGWDGSGQSLTVDLVENHFDNIGFYFDQESWGRTFDFRLSDAANSGATLFSTSFIVTSGLNVININQLLTPGAVVYALLDYNGFSGATAHFSFSDSYAGGHSVFLQGGSYNETFVSLDHRFIASFSGGQVPEPATLTMLGAALVGLCFARKHKKV